LLQFVETIILKPYTDDSLLQIMPQNVYDTARYYEEIVRILNEILGLIKQNNVIIKELAITQRDGHKINIGIADEVRKIRFNTQ
jgi:hypothetical protein